MTLPSVIRSTQRSPSEIELPKAPGWPLLSTCCATLAQGRSLGALDSTVANNHTTLPPPEILKTYSMSTHVNIYEPVGSFPPESQGLWCANTTAGPRICNMIM